MKTMYKYLIILLIPIGLVKGQNIEEQVYLHLNSSNLVVGETLLFSAHVQSKLTNLPSPLSKILYVELINSKGIVAHQSKILLENGRGSGEIFFSSTYPTGSYHLIAYTGWMTNFNEYFESVIVVINPFQKVENQNTSSEWSIDFYPKNQSVIQNIENQFVYHLNSNAKKMPLLKGRIVDSSGEKILDITPGDHSFGSFQFKPKSSLKYQAILEDENGEFYFFDLPKVEQSGTRLLVTQNRSAYHIKVESTEPDFEGTVKIYQKNRITSTFLVTPGFQYPIAKNNISNDLFSIALLNNTNETIETRLILDYEYTAESNVEKLVYGKRDFVKKHISVESGNYSISVRKTNDIFNNYRTKTIDNESIFQYIKNYYHLPIPNCDLSQFNNTELHELLYLADEKHTEDSASNIYRLPDYRGELISGYALSERSNAIQNKSIIYSSLGNDQLAIASTKSDGRFTLNIPPVDESTKSFITLMDTSDYSINIESNFIKEKPTFYPPKIVLDSNTIAQIVRRSINTQIENAYFDLKKDSTRELLNPKGIIGEFDYLYHLDDYNRFPTIRETFIEYIPAVYVRRKHGKPSLSTRSGEYSPTQFNKEPLVLLDGLPVTAEDLFKFSPHKVEKIGIINKRFYFGPDFFDGLIYVQTYEGNLYDFEIDKNILQFEYQAVQTRKQYYQPDYSTSSNDRIPDYREQLYWNPNIQSNNGSLDFQFYTSDVSGDFEIVIEGYSDYGDPVSIVQPLKVE